MPPNDRCPLVPPDGRGWDDGTDLGRPPCIQTPALAGDSTPTGGMRNEHDKNNIDKDLRTRAEYREKYDEHQAKRDQMLEELKQRTEYVNTGIDMDSCAQIMAEAETRIKMLAHTEWILTQNKHPHEKVEVKIFKTFKVINADTLRDWVLKNLPAALDPNLRKIE